MSRLANVNEPLGRNGALHQRGFARLFQYRYKGMVGFGGVEGAAAFHEPARLLVAPSSDAGAQQAAELFELLRHFG